jgi:hypothetical protein
MKFKKSQRKAKVAAEKIAKSPDATPAKTAVAFSGDAVTTLVRGYYAADKETAMAACIKELVDIQGYKMLSSPKGRLQLTAVMEGKKRFKGLTTDKKSVLVTAFVKKAV